MGSGRSSWLSRRIRVLLLDLYVKIERNTQRNRSLINALKQIDDAVAQVRDINYDQPGDDVSKRW